MLAKAPNRTRATEYLIASGAAAITLSETNKVCSISTGKVPQLREVRARWWTAAADAARVASAARLCAGADPNLPAATASTARSAAALGATLTPDDVAISRANAAVVRLDLMIEQMRRDGTLQEFNSRYKRGRAAAAAVGQGFMGYAPA
jgi:hypothetical protein